MHYPLLTLTCVCIVLYCPSERTLGYLCSMSEEFLIYIALFHSIASSIEVAVLFLFNATGIFCPWFWNIIQLVIPKAKVRLPHEALFRTT